MIKEIKTPWGKIIPEVSLLPIYYLLFIYCFVYILPYGKFFIGISWFDWLRSEDGPLESMQFIEYALSSLLAFLIFRFLDIIKPSIINRSQYFDYGIGIMLDDILSGLITLLILSGIYL